LTTLPLISIVDDDQSVREATADLVESCGYAAAAFASAEELLQSEHLRTTSCVVTDVCMTGLSGVELQRRLADVVPHIPVIFLTAFPEEHVRAAALDGGARGFFAKPVPESTLILCIESVLRSPSGAPTQ
jgi:FixJ family two-component response regulator